MARGLIERFNGRLRDECPNAEIFDSLANARRTLALWRCDDKQRQAAFLASQQNPVRRAAGA